MIKISISVYLACSHCSYITTNSSIVLLALSSSSSRDTKLKKKKKKRDTKLNQFIIQATEAGVTVNLKRNKQYFKGTNN